MSHEGVRTPRPPRHCGDDDTVIAETALAMAEADDGETEH